MLVACSGEDSGLPSVSSFHYVEIVTGHIDGDPLDSREEGYYRAPDSARVIGDAQYSPLGFENIVIGSQVWSRRDAGWSAGTTDIVCYHALVKMDWILRLARELEGFTDEGDGPIAGGERTRRYSWASDDAGRNLIIGTERNLAETPENAEVLASTKEVFGDLKGTIEIAVGDESGPHRNAGIRRCGYRPGEVDARDQRGDARNLAVCAAREGVFVVHPGPLDADQDLAGRQVVDAHVGDGALHRISAPLDDKRAESPGRGHLGRSRGSRRAGRIAFIASMMPARDRPASLAPGAGEALQQRG